ncbi:MAG: oxidoreductase, partial [Chitinophagaceae bacterium]
IGTVRKETQLQEVNNLVVGKTFGYLLDVNNRQQVNETIATVIEQFGKIDVLVNNAGYGFFGGIEESDMENVRAQMETNFFGALAVTQAVLPFMRKQKRGHVIQISSIAGISSTPGLGIYNASKFALEGFSEALYYEVAPLGIHVSLVEPGPFRTLWAGASMKFAQNKIADYEPTVGKIEQMLAARNGRQPGDPVKGSLAIIQLTETANPPLRLALGKIAIGSIQNKINLLQKELTAWESVSASADYE